MLLVKVATAAVVAVVVMAVVGEETVEEEDADVVVAVADEISCYFNVYNASVKKLRI